MAINFPNNPSANDTFTAGNIQYVYLNGKWQVNAGLVAPFSPTITNAVTGQTLVWNGTAWVNGEAAADWPGV